MTARPAAGHFLQRWLVRYVALSLRLRGRLLFAVLLVTAGAAFMARSVAVDARLEGLLPERSASISAVSELKGRIKSSSPLFLLVQSGDLELSRRLAREVHRRVSAWPETQWAMYKRDPEYFLSHRLLYLHQEDLVELNDQIDERHRWEQCKRLPGCTNLEDTAPELPTDENLKGLFEKDPDVKALLSLFGSEAEAFSTSKPRKVESNPAPAAPASAATDVKADSPTPEETGGSSEIGELCDVERGVCAVQVALDGDPGDLQFATDILNRSEALLAAVRQQSAPDAEELKMVVGGRYRSAPMMQRQVSADLTKTALIGALLVLLVVLAQFRGARSLVVLLGPAAAAIVWTLGLVGLWTQSLNLISAFTLAVLAGVGIDFGVHLLTHYARARRAGQQPEVALREGLLELAPSLVVAAVTTSSGFGALAAAQFRGFSQMGPIAALGVLLSLISFFLVFPPLVALLDSGEKACPFQLRGLQWSPWALLKRHAGAVMVGGVLLATGLAWLGRGVEFEYDFRRLRVKGGGHGVPSGGALHGTGRNAVYLLADDQKELQAVSVALRQNRPQDISKGDTPFLINPGAFIPPAQKERLQAVAELRETLQLAKKDAPEEVRQRIEDFEPLVEVETPIQLEGMPQWVSSWLVERDGRFGTLGILYTSLSGSDARQMEHLATRLEQWRQRFGKVRFASPVAQLGEVTPRLRADAPVIIALALLGVGLGTLLVGRSLRRVLVVFLPLVLTMAVSLGLMALGDFRVNLYNMLVFPLAFGIGVDGAVYVVWALAARGGAEERLPVAARAVLGSTLTSMAGFGSLMASSNPGLSSIGAMALLMLGVSLLANLIWLPSAAFWLRSRRRSA